MTTIGFIGSGNIGSTVARLAVDSGYDVVLSNSRGPQTLSDLVSQLGPKAGAATSAEAARAGDLVVVTIPLGKIDELPADALAGKTVIDTCNYYPERDGRIAALDAHETTTSQLVQDQLPDSRVVKGFNNIYFKALAVLGRPTDSGDRSVLPIFGDEIGTKTGVAEFLDTIGYGSYDAGSLADSWRAENGQPAYVMPYTVGGQYDQPGPADGPTVRRLLGEATRDGGAA